MARDPADVLDLVVKSDFASTLHRMLAANNHSNDPLWLVATNAGPGILKAVGISKAEVLMVSVCMMWYMRTSCKCEVGQHP